MNRDCRSDDHSLDRHARESLLAQRNTIKTLVQVVMLILFLFLIGATGWASLLLFGTAGAVWLWRHYGSNRD